jgi:hypothetical protein
MTNPTRQINMRHPMMIPVIVPVEIVLGLDARLEWTIVGVQEAAGDRIEVDTDEEIFDNGTVDTGKRKS